MSEEVKKKTYLARVAGVKAFQVLDLVDAACDTCSNPSLRNVQKTVRQVKRVTNH